MCGDNAGTRALACYASRIDVATLPPDVIERARHVVLDTCGALLSGAQLEPGRALITFARDLVGRPEACLLYTSPSPRDLSTARMPSSA